MGALKSESTIVPFAPARGRKPTLAAIGVPNVECGDNLPFMKTLANGSMQLIVTSPPYNIGKVYESKRLTLDSYLESQKKIIQECVRLLAPRGSICWQVGNHVTSSGELVPLDIALYPIFKSFELKLRNRIVWHFGHGLHCSKRLSGRHETFLWFTRSDDYVFNLDAIRVPVKYPNKKSFKGPKKGQISSNPLGKNPGDVWIVPNVKANHVEKTEHPCQFPVELIERLVLALTNEGDKVLDPYMGVGSTVIAAIKHQRDGYGVDNDRRFVEIAKDRIALLRRGELKLRPMNRPVFEPKVTQPTGAPARKKAYALHANQFASSRG